MRSKFGALHAQIQLFWKYSMWIHASPPKNILELDVQNSEIARQKKK
jgi:hypothetical protein